MPVALDELKTVYGIKRAFIVADADSYKNGFVSALDNKLDELSIPHFCYFDIDGMFTASDAEKAAEAALLFEPDAIIAAGRGTAMDAAKLVRLMYEHEDADICALAEEFNDISSREKLFFRLGEKALLVTVPDIDGCAGAVSPYAVFSENDDEKVIADYELMADIAVVDGGLMTAHTKTELIDAGINALVRSVNAYDASDSSEYTDSYAVRSVSELIDIIPGLSDESTGVPSVCAALAEAITMSGIAYSNTSSVVDVDGSAPFLADIISLSAAESEEVCKRYAELAEALSLDGADDKTLCGALVDKIKKLF